MATNWTYADMQDKRFIEELIESFGGSGEEKKLEMKFKIGALVECVSDGGSKKLKVEHCYVITGHYWQNGRFYIILHGTPSSSPKLGYLAERFKLWEEVHGV